MTDVHLFDEQDEQHYGEQEIEHLNEILTPRRIWITPGTMLSKKKQLDNDVSYVRADRHTALLDAAVSLHHWLFELTDTMLNRPDVGEREIADMLDDARLAINKYDRFCDAN